MLVFITWLRLDKEFKMDLRLNKKTLPMLLGLSAVVAVTQFVSASSSNDGTNVVEQKLPIGSVVNWGSLSIPSGWLEMNGQSTAGNPELAAIYGSNLHSHRYDGASTGRKDYGGRDEDAVNDSYDTQYTSTVSGGTPQQVL